MKIGVIYPQTELGGDPEAVAAFGKAAEALGYDYLAMFDHIANLPRRGIKVWSRLLEGRAKRGCLIRRGAAR